MIKFKSFEIASSKRDDLVLIMNGQNDKKLNNLNSIKENDRILIIGPQKDINHLYQNADVVVLPSKSDSFPYVMLEVGVHKKPFIGGNTGTSMLGQHQGENIALAIAAVEQLQVGGVYVTDRDIQEGIQAVMHPGRMEIVSAEPLILLDGAHNPAGMMMLVRTLQEDFSTHRLVVILGALKDKDLTTMVSMIVPVADAIIVTKSRNPRAADPMALKELITSIDIDKTVFVKDSIPRAIDHAKRIAKQNNLICVTGSLFTVSSFAALAWSRRRVFGVLRHLGLTRGEVIRLLSLEGGAAGIIGAVLGLASGAVVSVVLVHVVNRQSFHWGMAIHWPWLALAALSASVILLCALGASAAGRAAVAKEAVHAVKDDA